MAKILTLTSRAKMPKKDVAKAQIAKAEAAAKADAAEKQAKTAKQLEKALGASTMRDGVVLNARQAKVFDALLAGKVTRLAISKLIWSQDNRIGEAGALIYSVARPTSGTSAGKSKVPSYYLGTDRSGGKQYYWLIKREEPKAAKKRPTAKKTGRAK